jgi:hypothetical protein
MCEDPVIDDARKYVDPLIQMVEDYKATLVGTPAVGATK